MSEFACAWRVHCRSTSRNDGVLTERSPARTCTAEARSGSRRRKSSGAKR
uniref:Uncharacterized protein n=1 Tax=Arundo donax TaxID=35708 RepID=A0A0A9AL37_ARUDO